MNGRRESKTAEQARPGKVSKNFMTHYFNSKITIY